MKCAFDKSGSAIKTVFSYKDPCLICQVQISACESLEIGVHGFRPGHDHNIPAGLEFFFIQPVNLPDAAADPIADHSMPQLFADGDAHPIGVCPILPGIQHKIAVCLPVGPIQPLKNVIQFQRTGKFHSDLPRRRLFKKPLAH